MNEYVDVARMIELERADASRKVLEEFANFLEMKNGADQYERAWRIAANDARMFRPKAS